MKYTIRTVTAVLLLTASAFIYYGCSCNCDTTKEADVPAAVLKNANEIIISKTGKDFFEKYISIDLARSNYMAPDYFLVYRMIIPEKPYVNERIELTVDAEGNLNNSFETKGIPDCANGGCDFTIDEAKALGIAKANGLETGIKDWEAVFGWDETSKSYAWHVLSTLSESGEDDAKKSSGKEIIINPNTGNVIEQSEWVAK